MNGRCNGEKRRGTVDDVGGREGLKVRSCFSRKSEGVE